MEKCKMANFSKLCITDAGKRLLNLKLNAGDELSFVEMVMSERKYDMAVLEELTGLEGIRLTEGKGGIWCAESEKNYDCAASGDLQRGFHSSGQPHTFNHAIHIGNTGSPYFFGDIRMRGIEKQGGSERRSQLLLALLSFNYDDIGSSGQLTELYKDSADGAKADDGHSLPHL